MEKKLLFISTLFFFITAQAQFNKTLVSPVGAAEVSISINPDNPAQMVIGCNYGKSYYSSDSGNTWTACTANTLMNYSFDPSVITDTSGNFYFFNIRASEEMHKSVDGGQTWSINTHIDSVYDKEYVCIDPFTNDIYLTYFSGLTDRVSFRRSSDGGNSWTPDVRINTISYNNIIEPPVGAIPVAGPNGEVYVTWFQDHGIFFQKSLDRGNTWMASDTILHSFDTLASSYINIPTIASDLSGGTYNGNIYLCWAEPDSVSAFYNNLYFARYERSSNTWSVIPLTNNIYSDEKLPWICVDQSTGYIYLVYYFQGIFSEEVRLAFSTDGGNNFNHIGINDSPIYYLTQQHYIGCSAVNGMIRPTWASQDSVFTALISQAQLNQFLSVQESKSESELKIYPNPGTGIFTISNPCEMEAAVSVLDIHGRIISETRTKSENILLDLSAEPEGIYLVQMRCGNAIRSNKICISR